ncbi:MAG: hypothetical protein HY431_01835 [Candidatus Levybacteria bacterium]|nr:hypothetical protein [Candidatus Levybacteria bacterium]
MIARERSISSEQPTPADLDYFKVGERGLLPAVDPATALPKKFAFLDEYAVHLPNLLENHNLRREMDHLKPFDISGFHGAALHRGNMITAYLASGYVHQIGEERATRLPEGIANPLYEITKRIGKNHPILSYDGYGLGNWRKKDPNGPLEIENLDTLLTFTNLPDERWFILIHSEIEAEAAPAVQALQSLQEAALWGNDHGVENHLQTIRNATLEMVTTLRRMPEGNSPEQYATGFRPYIQGFDGVAYEGVQEYNGEPQFLRGETGAQSSIMPALDIALGVEHDPENIMARHLKEMKEYMPRRHQEFLQQLQKRPSVRGYIKKSGSKILQELYNDILDNQAKFRTQHLEFAKTYILNKVGDTLGTGRTEYPVFLANMRDKTYETKIAR